VLYSIKNISSECADLKQSLDDVKKMIKEKILQNKSKKLQVVKLEEKRA